MSLLHDAFNTRNFLLFQRLLDTPNAADKSPSVLSASAGKTSKHSSLGIVDVNQRDWLGRTVLHLASTAIEDLDCVRVLLKHPAINVNVTDTESHWTPLHRSLYSANLPAA
jgi:ankyrin repeat protein